MKGKKTGGRQKGTPNKENPLKGYLREHSLRYFSPNPENPDSLSDFDIDMLSMPPTDRAGAELRLLEFHTPKMKAVEVDMDIRGSVHTIEDRLKELCGETDSDEE